RTCRRWTRRSASRSASAPTRACSSAAPTTSSTASRTSGPAWTRSRSVSRGASARETEVTRAMSIEPLSPPTVAKLLNAAVATIHAEMAALPPPALAWHPASGEWCVKEVLGHLIETEQRGFAGRIRIILAGDTPPLETWDQEAVARARQDCARDWTALLAEFSRLRADSAELVARLRPEALGRGGQPPKVGFLQVGDLLHEWVHPARTHIRQMLANTQALVWPYMGNARRFSEP